MLGRRATARLAVFGAMSFYGNVKEVHVHLVYESELLKPNTFCRRRFLVQLAVGDPKLGK